MREGFADESMEADKRHDTAGFGDPRCSESMINGGDESVREKVLSSDIGASNVDTYNVRAPAQLG